MEGVETVNRVPEILSGLCAILLCSGCVSGYFYYPDSRVYQTPAAFKLPYKEVEFKSRDGTLLKGWWVPAVGKALGTVIRFHGNAQNMSSHFSYVSWLPREGFNVFTFDYRGYGGSHGRPERQGIYEDCIAALEYVRSFQDADPDALLLFGQSLGGANAIAVMGDRKYAGVKAVVIDSTFYSYRSVVRDKINAIPVLCYLKWPLSFLLIGNSHSPAEVVDRISPVPVLFVHGTADQVIPDHHSQWLYDAAKEPKEIWKVEGGGHAEAFIGQKAEWREKLVKFFKKTLGYGKDQ